MKQIKAFIHHVRTAAVIEALGDAGYRNITLHDVKGTLRPITENERDYSAEAGGLVISEVKLSLVVDDAEVDAVTSIVRTVGRVGLHPHVCGYVYVSPVEQALPIGGTE
jgi:nitrogen regulatory protein P-II 1